MSDKTDITPEVATIQEGIINPADPPQDGSGVTIHPAVEAGGDLMGTVADIIASLENEVEVYRNVSRAQAGMIDELRRTVQAQRAALEAAKILLEDENNRDGLVYAYEDGVLGFCPAATDEAGRVETDEDGKPYSSDCPADFAETIAAMNEGLACWDETEAPNYPEIILWIQIWKALNPGKEFKKLEDQDA